MLKRSALPQVRQRPPPTMGFATSVDFVATPAGERCAASFSIPESVADNGCQLTHVFFTGFEKTPAVFLQLLDGSRRPSGHPFPLSTSGTTGGRISFPINPGQHIELVFLDYEVKSGAGKVCLSGHIFHSSRKRKHDTRAILNSCLSFTPMTASAGDTPSNSDEYTDEYDSKSSEEAPQLIHAQVSGGDDVS